MTSLLFKGGLAMASVAIAWLFVKKVQQARRIYFFHNDE